MLPRLPSPLISLLLFLFPLLQSSAVDLKTKEEKDAELDRRIEALRKKNEALVKRYQVWKKILVLMQHTQQTVTAHLVQETKH